MANRRMLPHTVTIFRAIGEGDDFKQRYEVTVHEHVYCPELAKGYSGQKPRNGLTALLFDTATSNMESFKLEGNGNEYIAPYHAAMCGKPPSDARTIRLVRRRKNGTPRMWHWEVHAE